MDGSKFLGHFKPFIKSSDAQQSATPKNQSQLKLNVPNISGSEVKSFYDATIRTKSLNVDTTIKKPVKSTTVPKKGKCINKPFSINELMKAVENNDITTVTSIIESNKEHINSTDQFGWTPLMAACCSGKKSMVELLLQWSPEMCIKDKSGNSCRALALAKGHNDVIRILDEYQTRLSMPRSKHCEELQETTELATFYCETCKQNISNTTEKKHISSLVHIFYAEKESKRPTIYGISENNKGFQMLLRSGWNKEEGLGSSGQGHKYPPKSVLKHDRSGLGAKKYKARVTHSAEILRKEAKPKPTYKRQLIAKKRNEQRQERTIRNMLS